MMKARLKKEEFEEQIQNLTEEMDHKNSEAQHQLSSAQEDVAMINDEQWDSLKQSKSPLLQKTLKIVCLMMGKVVDIEEWSWKNTKKVLEEKQFPLQVAMFEATTLSMDIIDDLKVMLSSGMALLDEWGLRDIVDRITTAMIESCFEIDDPVSWEQISQEELKEEPFTMNEQQIKKWNNGLKKYLKMREEERMAREWTFERVNEESMVGGTIFSWIRTQRDYAVHCIQTKPINDEICKLQKSVNLMELNRQSLEEEVKSLTLRIEEMKEQSQKKIRSLDMREAEVLEDFIEITGDQLKLLKNTKKPSISMQRTLKAIWLMLNTAEDSKKWKWKESQNMLDNKEFKSQIMHWNTSEFGFDELKSKRVQALFPESSVKDQEDWRSLLVDWDLADFVEKMEEYEHDEYDVHDVMNWEMISDQELIDHFEMNKKQRKKWNDGLSRHHVVRTLLDWVSVHIEICQVPIEIECELNMVIDQLQQCEDLLKKFQIPDEDMPQSPNEGFVQRLWESDPNVVYVE